MTLRSVIVAMFEDEMKLLKATKAVKDEGMSIVDVFSPFAIHGIEEAMGIKRSRLPIVCFFAGLGGCALAFWFQIWISASSWPINVGGKPFNSFVAFIPVAFEMTVLLGGLVTVAAFMFRSRLFPGKKERIVDFRTTNDRFALVVETKDASFDPAYIESFLKKFEPKEIRREELNL